MRFILLLFVIVAFNSCINSKKYNEVRLGNKSVTYSITLEQDDNGDQFIRYDSLTPSSGTLVQVDVSGDYLEIEKITKGKLDKGAIKFYLKDLNPATFNKLSALAGGSKFKGKKVFPSPLMGFEPHKDDQDAFKGILTVQKTPVSLADEEVSRTVKFKYKETNTVFQTMTIPFKYRSQLNDTVAAQVSSSFNVGFALGRKVTFRTFDQRFRGDKFLAAHNPSYSITPGVFAGPTLISLENGKSVSEPIALNRTVGGVTAGAFLVIGVERFNVGFAYGFDKALGTDSEKWLYQKDPWWWGFVLSLDFIK